MCGTDAAGKIAMQIEKIIKLMQTDDSVDAPSHAIEQAKNIFRGSIREPKKSILQRVIAVLQADLLPDKAAFGERSASVLKSRQLLYTAGDTGIDLRVSDAAGRIDIHGQILSDAEVCGAVRLFNDERSIESIADDLGEFHLLSVASGKYSLSITCDDREIFIEKIDLR
jgi:hypothetical protein